MRPILVEERIDWPNGATPAPSIVIDFDKGVAAFPAKRKPRF